MTIRCSDNNSLCTILCSRASCACLLACGTLLIAGCGNGSGTERADSQAKPLQVLAAPEAERGLSVAQAPPSPEELRAREVFSQLVAPGVEAGRWEELHEELLTLGPACVHVLSERLRSGSDVERELAATTLALLGPESGVGVASLTSALEDPLPFVRANAAAALVQVPDSASRAVPALIALLHSPDPQLREMAAVNLAAVGPAAAGAVDGLRRTLTAESAPEVIGPVVELLGRIGPAAEPALQDLRRIAVQQPGEIGKAAETAIQLISGEAVAP